MRPGAKHPGGRPRKQVDLDELKRLLQEGRSLRQIATELGHGFGTVHRVAKALRYDPHDPKLSEVIQNPAA